MQSSVDLQKGMFIRFRFLPQTWSLAPRQQMTPRWQKVPPWNVVPTEHPEPAWRHMPPIKIDDDYNKQSSSNGGRTSLGTVTRAENHSGAAAPREKHGISKYEFAAVRATYEKVTGNLWSQSDSETYAEHGLDQVPVERIISALDAFSKRSPVKINSFKYFVKEVTALPNPRNRARQKKQLGNIVRRIRDNSVGRADYSEIDFREDVEIGCYSVARTSADERPPSSSS